MCFFGYNILSVFLRSLDHFPVLLFIVSDFVSTVGLPSQEIGWEERLRNDLFCVKWDLKP